MVSDQEIASCVESLLRQSGPNAIASVNGVVRELEAKLGLDLSHKASFIRDQIDLLVGPPKDRFALQTHHQFHLHPHPQAHPFHQPHPQFQPLTPASSSSPFTHLLHHQELSFRYPPQPLLASAAAEQEFRQQQHEQLQQQQHPPPPLPAQTAPQHAATSQKESALAGVKRRGGPGGLSKVCGVSPQLQAIVGEPTMARTQIVKQLWAYIRKNNLQDPNNKRKIICNDELRMVFETDCTDMFKMNKLLAKHIIPLESTSPSSKRLKATATEVVSATEPDADQYPVVISDALAKFFGTGEREMLQSEALQRVWDYIKNNQLEDPMNTMMILCDSKLQQLFECESLSALGMSEMLSRHLFKQS